MNSGPNVHLARNQARANADRDGKIRFIHLWNGNWWISTTPCAGCEAIYPSNYPLPDPELRPLSQRWYDVEDFGTVTGENAVFTQFLERLRDREGRCITLKDLKIGHVAKATFHSGMGTDTVDITQLF